MTYTVVILQDGETARLAADALLRDELDLAVALIDIVRKFS